MRKNQHMAIPHFSIPFFVSIMKKEAFATVEKLWLLGGRQSVLCKLGLIPWKWETFLLLLPRKMPPILAPSPSFSFFFSSSFSFLPLLILEETRRLAATASPLQSSYRSQLVWVGKNRDRSRRGLYTSSNCFGIRVYTLFPSLSLSASALERFLRPENLNDFMVADNTFASKGNQADWWNYSIFIKIDLNDTCETFLETYSDYIRNNLPIVFENGSFYCDFQTLWLQVGKKIYKRVSTWFLFSWKLTLEIARELLLQFHEKRSLRKGKGLAKCHVHPLAL